MQIIRTRAHTVIPNCFWWKALLKLKSSRTIQKRRNWRFPMANKNHYSRDQAHVSLLGVIPSRYGMKMKINLWSFLPLKYSQGKGSFIQVQWKGNLLNSLKSIRINYTTDILKDNKAILASFPSFKNEHPKQLLEGCKVKEIVYFSLTVMKIPSKTSDSLLFPPGCIPGSSRLFSDLN